MQGGGFSSDTKPGAIANVVLCAVLGIAAVVFAVTNTERGAAYVVIAVLVTVAAVVGEVYFVRRLREHLRR